MGAVVYEGGAAEIRAMGTAATLANAASSLAMGLGSANRATVASLVSDDDDGISAADETPMVSSAAAETTAEGGATVRAAALVERPAEGGATVGAAALVERLRMGLPPIAGSVADADSGGVFLAMTDE